MLQHAMREALSNRYYFLEGAIYHFMDNAPEGSVARAVAHELESSAYDLLMGAAAVALDMVPRLQKLLPWQEYGDVYAAMVAADVDAKMPKGRQAYANECHPAGDNRKEQYDWPKSAGELEDTEEDAADAA